MEPGSGKGLFYCEVCDCEVKDSATFRDHINGKDHNKKLGINLKEFEDSTLDEVKAMLQKKIRERQEKLDNPFKPSDEAVPGERAYEVRTSDMDDKDEEDDELEEEDDDE